MSTIEELRKIKQDAYDNWVATHEEWVQVDQRLNSCRAAHARAVKAIQHALNAFNDDG